MKLRQGQKYEDFYLTPSGLMARMVGGRQKIIVPKSLRQQILKECHDVPFTRPCGHAQDFGTCGLGNSIGEDYEVTQSST